MVLTTQRGALALVATAALAAGVLLFSITSLASPEPGVPAGQFLVIVDVNIMDSALDDPSQHAIFIEMPAQLTLTINLTDVNTLTTDITISGDPPWVEVSGAIEGGQIFASGSGTVATHPNIAVIFQGKIDGEGLLSGQYRMGTAGGLPNPFDLPESPPIKYTLKPAGACPPGGGGAAGCPPGAETPLPTAPASETPTATPTEGAPPTNTPTPSSEPCTDPDLGGGELLFSGIGTQNHTADEQGGLCPGESDVWTFSTLGLGIEEFIGIRVTEKTGSVSVSILLPDGSDVALQPGEEFRDSQPGPPAAYEVTVTGTAEGLASYRLEVCRAISDACVFSEDITPTPTPRNGDVNMDGVTNSLDVLLVLQLIAGLISPTPNFDRADVNMDGEVNAVDTALMLQFDAGLLDSLPVGQ